MNNYPSPNLCPNCGNSVSTEDSFCPVCGTAVPAPEPISAPAPGSSAAATERRCASCGTVLPDGASFCSECGTPVPASAPTPVIQPAPVPAEQRCASCGELLNPDAAFCGNCGAKVVKNAAPIPPTQPFHQPPVYSPSADSGYHPPVHTPPSAPSYQPPIPSAASPASFSWWPRTNRLSDLCGSGISLTMAILVSVSLLFSLISAFLSDGFGVLTLINTAFSEVSAILFCIGLWICFAGGRKNTLSTSGFTVLSAGLIYTMVILCLIAACFLIVGIACIAAPYVISASVSGFEFDPWDYVSISAMRVIGVFLIIIGGAITALGLIFLLQLRHSVKSAKQVVMNGQGQIDTHMFSIVLLYIGVGFSILGLISSLALGSAIDSTFGYSVASFDFLSFLTTAVEIALPILAALTLQRLNRNQTVWVR